MKISLIAAMAVPSRVIGRDNKLPWHLPIDLQYFKEKTAHKVVVMGRKTFESLPVALPDRKIIILTHDKNLTVPGCIVIRDIKELDSIVGENDELMVAGGEKIYELFLPLANKVYLTKVYADVSGDTYFPYLDMNAWEEIACKKYKADQKNKYDFDFVLYKRKKI